MKKLSPSPNKKHAKVVSAWRWWPFFFNWNIINCFSCVVKSLIKTCISKQSMFEKESEKEEIWCEACSNDHKMLYHTNAPIYLMLFIQDLVKYNNYCTLAPIYLTCRLFLFLKIKSHSERTSFLTIEEVQDNYHGTWKLFNKTCTRLHSNTGRDVGSSVLGIEKTTLRE